MTLGSQHEKPVYVRLRDTIALSRLGPDDQIALVDRDLVEAAIARIEELEIALRESYRVEARDG